MSLCVCVCGRHEGLSAGMRVPVEQDGEDTRDSACNTPGAPGATADLYPHIGPAGPSPQQAVGECLASGRGRRQRETSTPPGGGRDPSNILLSYCPALAGMHPLDGAPRLRQWADPRPIPLQLHTRQSLTSLPTQLPPEGPARLFRRGSDRTGLWSVCSVPGHRQTLKSLLPPLPAGSANASNESPADLANHRSQPPHRP